MINSKLGQVFISWQPEQRKQFYHFLASPYFNRQKILREIWKIWDTKFLSAKRRTLTAEKFHALAFPDKDFDQNQLRKLNTALLKLAMEFLAHEAFRKNDAHIHTYGLQALNELKHYKYYEQFQRVVKKQIEAPPTSFEKLSARHLEAHEQMAYSKFHHKKNDINHLAEATRALDQYYFSYRLFYAFNADNIEKITGASSSVAQIQGLLAYMKQQLKHSDILPKAMLSLYQLSGRGKKAKRSYKKLRNIFQNQRDQLDPSLIQSIYSALLNYCIRKLLQGKTSYRKEVMKIHISALEAEIHFKDNFFDYRDFYNIITNGLVLKKYEWARQVMEDYGDKLHPEHRDITLEFCEGRIAYYSGDFKQAKKIFVKLIFHQVHEDYFFEINSQQHLLQSLYELGEFIEIEERIGNVIARLENYESFNEARRKGILEFFSALKTLYKTPVFENEKLLPLQKEVNDNKHIANRKWLQTKIEERFNSSTR